MNLQATIDVYSGGPGSGCHGPNCGRARTRIDWKGPHLSSKHVSVDFDNTIAYHKTGHKALGHPLPNGLALLHALKDEGFTVHVHTARPDVRGVQKWLNDHGVGFAVASNKKIPSAAYIDDRALNWTGNEPVDTVMTRVREMAKGVAEAERLGGKTQ